MTRVAMIADLHGNYAATQALERDLQARGITRVWCLGDLVGKGPLSDKTFDWAVANCELILRGNWDEGIGRKLFPRDEFYYRQLGPQRMNRLKGFPLEYVCYVSGKKMRLMHGRPIMQGVMFVHRSEDVLAPYFLPDYDIVGYADVHRQGTRLMQNGGILFNTGSVGNGLGVPDVQYVILEGELDSAEPAGIDIRMVMTPYDREQAIEDTRQAEKEGLVNAESFITEIRTGRYSR